MQSRKASSALTVFLVAAAFLLGAPGPLPSADFNWRKFEGTRIRVLTGKSAFSPLTEKQIKEFQELTGITVQNEEYPAVGLRNKLLMELGAGNKDLEVYQAQWKDAYQYDTAGWAYPIDEFLKNPAMVDPGYDFSDFFPRLHAVINGRTVGIITSCNPQALIYRKDLFEKHGVKVPTSWKELEEAAQKLTLDTDGDGKTDVFGWIARMSEENTATFSMFLFNNGGAWLDANRKPVFNSPQGVEAMKFYGRLMKQFGPPGGSSFSWKEVIASIAQGKAAMTLEVSQFALMSLENPQSSKVVGRLGYAPFPAAAGGPAKSVLPANMYFINARSEKKEAAWYFLQFMTRKETFLPYQIKGLPMARRSVWEHPKAKEAVALPELTRLQFEALQNGILDFEIPIAGFAEARPLIERAVFSAYEGGDTQKAADEAAAGVRDIMKRTEKQ
jgi:multiple sugar transport system substrate-binding protein